MYLCDLFLSVSSFSLISPYCQWKISSPPSFQPLKKAIVTIYFLNHKQISWSFTTVLLIRIEFQKVKNYKIKRQAWMVARATMTLSSVSPAWPLKMTPWNSWQICYHSSTAKKFFTEKTYSKTLCSWRTEIFSWSYKLTTTLIELERKFPSRIRKDWQLRRKKGSKIKGEALTTAFCKAHLKRACCSGVWCNQK